MIGFIIVVLVICALIAAIWGKQAGQKAFGCIALGSIILLAIAIIFFVKINDATTPSSTSDSGSTNNIVVGINEQYMNAQNEALTGLPTGAGIYVDAVIPNSPASNAGVLAGDLIVKIDNQLCGMTPSYNYDVIAAKNADSLPGKMALTIYRAGNYYNISIAFS